MGISPTGRRCGVQLAPLVLPQSSFPLAKFYYCLATSAMIEARSGAIKLKKDDRQTTGAQGGVHCLKAHVIAFEGNEQRITSPMIKRFNMYLPCSAGDLEHSKSSVRVAKGRTHCMSSGLGLGYDGQ